MHTPAPATLNRPAGHIATVAFVDPATHAYPAAHDPLQLAEPMAAVLPYRPAAQSTHTLVPAREYLPAGHVEAVGLVDPAAHTYPALQLPEHPGDDRPATDPYRPAAHGAVHDATPMFGVAPYRPALQLLHTPAPAREYVPAGQLTAVELVDPAGHTYPALQLPEHAATDMADVDPYRPGAQFVHTPAPATLY